MGLKLENTKISQLGKARRIAIDKDSTTIIDGAGDADGIKARSSSQLRDREHRLDFDREKLQERQRLAGGVAVIKVGAATETEMKEKKHPASRTPCRPPAPPSRRASSRGGVAL